MAAANGKPKLAVHKFASCDGCQLSLLNLEDELVTLAGAVDIAYFVEARSRLVPGPYDVALVEGSITTPEDEERIRKVRADAKYLIAIGACATAGGIQALRNSADVTEYTRVVYASPSYIHTLATSTPISAHVQVDFELNGCPVNKAQLLDVLQALLQGRQPRLPAHAVCMECKRNGTVCLAVARGIACLGPITHAGCGALCPSFNRGCFGCYGPMENANPEPLLAQYSQAGRAAPELVRLLRGFTGHAEVFRAAAERLENRP